MSAGRRRFTVALALSVAAHAGAAWLVASGVPSFARPAHRAVSVALRPAAPKAVHNSIAPKATTALAPRTVRPLAPPEVATIEEPDEIVLPLSAERVAELVPPRVAAEPAGERVIPRQPAAVAARTLAAPVPPSPAAPAAAPVTLPRPAPVESRVDPSVQRETTPRRPARRATAAGPEARPARSTARREAGAEPARERARETPGAGDEARRTERVAGVSGARREAAPAAGNRPPDYPWVSRAQGHEGRVVLRVWVSATGDPDRLDVWRSSGYRALDRAAMDAVAHWHFEPARRAGHDTPSLVDVPVVFRLE